jgi:VanZ family protein
MQQPTVHWWLKFKIKLHKHSPLKFSTFLPGIAWFLFGLVLVCLPGNDVPESDLLKITGFDKLVHAILFGGLVFFFCMPFKKSIVDRQDKINLFIKITLATCIWGITTEFIQKFFIPGRQFDLLDWAADSFGAILAFFISKRLFLPKSPDSKAG